MSSILRPLQLDEPSSETPRVLARSRRNASSAPVSFDEAVKETPHREFGPTKKSFNEFPSLIKKLPWKAYLIHIPIFLLGLLSYAGVIYIFTWIEPRSIQNVIVPNSFAPLILLAGFAHFFFFSFLFLNARRGLLMSLLLSALLFLRLQQVLTIPIAFWAVAAVVGAELLWILIRQFVWQVRRRVIARGLPNIPKMPAFRRAQASRHKEMSTDLGDTAHSQSVIEGQNSSHRRRGRKRKHHFFGK